MAFSLVLPSDSPSIFVIAQFPRFTIFLSIIVSGTRVDALVNSFEEGLISLKLHKLIPIWTHGLWHGLELCTEGLPCMRPDPPSRSLDNDQNILIVASPRLPSSMLSVGRMRVIS